MRIKCCECLAFSISMYFYLASIDFKNEAEADAHIGRDTVEESLLQESIGRLCKDNQFR